MWSPARIMLLVRARQAKHAGNIAVHDFSHKHCDAAPSGELRRKKAREQLLVIIIWISNEVRGHSPSATSDVVSWQASGFYSDQAFSTFWYTLTLVLNMLPRVGPRVGPFRWPRPYSDAWLWLSHTQLRHGLVHFVHDTRPKQLLEYISYCLRVTLGTCDGLSESAVHKVPTAGRERAAT